MGRPPPPPPLPPRSWETDIIGIEPGLESGAVFGLLCSWRGPSKLCIWDLNTSYTIVPIHIFGPHAVYTGSSDRPRLPCAVFCDDTHICGLPECIYIIPLTYNEGYYVLAMNGFLLVRVRASHRHMSLNQSSSSCVVRIPSHMLGLLGWTYIEPCVSRP